MDRPKSIFTLRAKNISSLPLQLSKKAKTPSMTYPAILALYLSRSQLYLSTPPALAFGVSSMARYIDSKILFKIAGYTLQCSRKAIYV